MIKQRTLNLESDIPYIIGSDRVNDPFIQGYYIEGIAGAIGAAGGAREKFSGNIWVIAATIMGPALISMLNKLRSEKSIIHKKFKEAKKMCKTTAQGNKAQYDECMRKSMQTYAKGMADTTQKEITLLQQAANKATDPKKKKAIQERIAKMQVKLKFFQNYAKNLQNKQLSLHKAEKLAKKQSGY